MSISKTGKPGKLIPYFISVGLVLTISLLCFFSTPFSGYRPVALILLMTVSMLAILFDILPVVCAAILSAISLYFFFIPPILTFHFAYSEDFLMLLIYLAVSLTNAIVVYKIRQERINRITKEEKENTKRLYNTILNSTSHELRTPISAIIGATAILQENKDNLSTGKQKVLINQIAAASMLLNRQVENLLNMSLLESGLLKANPDWIDTNELIYAVIHKLSETSSHNIQFSSNADLPLFKYDRALMEQVLLNLTECNHKYTYEWNYYH
jgi:two-component system sensor histidine kinase KdpD